MNTETFNRHLAHMQAVTVDTLAAKAQEYATDDRLHNFKQTANLKRTTNEDALGGMMAKHTISVYDMIHDSMNGKQHSVELWEEKIKDHINYLYLLWALVNEEKDGVNDERKPATKRRKCRECRYYSAPTRVCIIAGGRDGISSRSDACQNFRSEGVTPWLL